MNKLNLKKIAEELIDTFLEAGKTALEISKKGVKITIKPDKTPVTNGDLAVDKILSLKISNLTPNIPIISEETVDIKKKNTSQVFWLIDPIDGTNDYINNRNEFTLNAALILNKKPALGIIAVPAKKRIFYSYARSNSYELINNKEINLINNKNKNDKIKAVSYSDYLKPEILKIHNKYNVNSFVKMKSSLKFCVVATGEFDLYVAEPRACEWDIAAGHAILEHAGGKVTDFESNEILYGKKNFKNPSLILKSKNIT